MMTQPKPPANEPNVERFKLMISQKDITPEMCELELISIPVSLTAASLVRIPLAIILIGLGIFGSVWLGGAATKMLGESSTISMVTTGSALVILGWVGAKILHLVAPYQGAISKIKVTANTVTYFPNQDDLTNRLQVPRDGAKAKGIFTRAPMLPNSTAKMPHLYNVPTWLSDFGFYNYVSCTVIDGRIEFYACSQSGRIVRKNKIVLKSN